MIFKQWQLKDFDVDGGLAAGAHIGSGGPAWLDVDVPGDTYVALANAKRIEDPFRGRNENDLGWIAQHEWWWRTQFSISPAEAGEQIELIFEGLDTFAAVYLNGVLLGQTNNMFREWRFDVREHLRNDAENELAIAFTPPSKMLEASKPPLWVLATEKVAVSKRNLMRKAQFGWGWDWGPCLPTVGVWQPVRIERWKQSRITDLHFATQSIAAHEADVVVEAEIELLSEGKALTAEISIFDPKGKLLLKKGVSAQPKIRVALKINEPQLWWTADLGKQPLYTVMLRVLDGETVLDTRKQLVGIRTIALDTSADVDEPGTNFFRFVLNGVPIFARGANWIPATSFVGAMEESRYRDLLSTAVQANMNMMRVWGGGVYEFKAFYDLCDELGLLVWQDFMFACAPYPENEEAFVDNVRHEVQHQIKRLRNHPSLALWCGNNECQVIQDLINQMSKTDTALMGASYYDSLMPKAVGELDPTTPYWPGSPYGGGSPNSMRAGDVHNWTVWHGIPLVPDKELIGTIDRSPEGVAYTRYAEDQGRFISEFGIHAAPVKATLQRWMNPEDLELGSQGFLDRIKDEPKDKVNAMLIPVTGLPETLDQYIAFTMFTQAEGLKFGLEHFRRRKPHCSGTLIWQYNDCWPCVSWSLVDYDGVGKASYFATARAYAPVMASFKSLGDGEIALWITNDTLAQVSGDLLIEQLSFKGDVDWRVPVSFNAAANGSAPVWKGKAPDSVRDRVICVYSATNQFAPNRFLFAPVKDLMLATEVPPQIAIEKVSNHELHVAITSKNYLLFVHLTAEDPETRFSDNYFDLRPGEIRVITVKNKIKPLSSDSIALHSWNN
ncbi:glycoside hydrolase family 2 [Stenotrophobium rhamnosiphilum]|uniref:Beta-mannosidase B n=1 Tax=Stenotrophobium rhamnosiphilum TaxID=2029166 RepID=A0A2T5MH51_9GAMM|nr:glycoside hydrolase family 2 [Stenotrophobium rhamnosiphilum]